MPGCPTCQATEQIVKDWADRCMADRDSWTRCEWPVVEVQEEQEEIDPLSNLDLLLNREIALE